MVEATSESVTQLLARARSGDNDAFDRAFGLVHDQLRAAAHRQLRGRRNDTLCTTALINEVWLRLSRTGLTAHDREHFLALSARAMRMIVIDEARRALAAKRGGDLVRITLDESIHAEAHGAEELLALDAAMHRLVQTDPRLAQVVEWRYFAGMTEPEIAGLLGLTERTVRRDWRKARAFLQLEMSRAESRP